MKIIRSNVKLNAKAFTLIEMIGVLAVIGILAALLIPKIFDAINNARVNGAAVSINTIKTGTADHYAKYGVLNSSNGVSLVVALPSVVTNFDTILLNEQMIDKTLSVKICPTNPIVELVQVPTAIGNGAGAPTAATVYNSSTPADWAFDLADTNGVNSIAGSVGVVVFLPNVLETDAKALNDVIDGPALGVALGSATGDLYGRVKYSQQVNGVVQMTIYVTHR